MTDDHRDNSRNYLDLTPEQRRAADDRLLKVFGIAIAIMLAGLVAGLVAISRQNHEISDDSPPAEARPEVTIFEAEDQCEEFVKRRLKAPSTAKFEGTTARTVAEKWIVTGQVDAQNSFGAPLRSYFECTMRVEGDEWVLESVTGLR